MIKYFASIQCKSIDKKYSKENLKGNRSKNKQVGLHQAKKLLHSKGNHQQNEKATKWKKIFANLISHERLTSEIYKELIQLSSKVTHKQFS